MKGPEQLPTPEDIASRGQTGVTCDFVYIVQCYIYIFLPSMYIYANKCMKSLAW